MFQENVQEDLLAPIAVLLEMMCAVEKKHCSESSVEDDRNCS